MDNCYAAENSSVTYATITFIFCENLKQFLIDGKKQADADVMADVELLANLSLFCITNELLNSLATYLIMLSGMLLKGK